MENDLLADFITYEKASLGRRYVAAMIDFILVGILWTVLVYTFGDAEVGEYGTTSYKLDGFPMVVATFCPWFLLLPVAEAITQGQTIGKKFLGIRSAHPDGAHISFGKAITRHLLDFVDYLPFFGIVGLIMAARSKDFQRVGDRVAHTIVVKA